MLFEAPSVSYISEINSLIAGPEREMEIHIKNLLFSFWCNRNEDRDNVRTNSSATQS